ncbi:APO protein 4, mitochondrial isoform X2 [Dendrobium catenatum]|uniref:APO protein 4, mitochondrial isoform X2 n=1 Tax=Dendrobium catenatum TaxID=906689 RepID=UPI0010A0838E|nr:APO protein 4, mitochondrial isoform X2 [Dendrobium catenatum]
MAFGQMNRVMNLRFYSSKVDWKRLRPMILKRIRNRAGDYPVKSMIPVAEDVLEARQLLGVGISVLLKFIPIKSCKFCPEIFIGCSGHEIKTCHSFKRNINGVLELCYQAGADISNEILHNPNPIPDNWSDVKAEEISQIAQNTMDAWERLRLGVQKLLMVYPAKVCRHCSEVHIGPSGHKARLCGVFKYEGWRGIHMWKKAEVSDLVPLKLVWHRRPCDPPTLSDAGRGFYGHAPAVVEICLQAGARIPKKYYCMMKTQGLPPP